MAEGETNNVLTDATGNAPKVTLTSLAVTNRTISDVDQAFQVGETLINDWKKGISVAARITAKLNGERPYNQAKLKAASKDWKANVSTGFLQSECSKVLPRFFMPIKTAKYLTAASLPANHPEGEAKTAHFRQTITDTIRSWPKFNFWTRGIAREVGVFGFGFNAWFDEYEWRPTLFRMDKGFVPQGTEVMEEPAFFLAKYDYEPSELLALLKAGVDAERDEWQKTNVVQAINGAIPPAVDTTYPNSRTYEDLIRQSAVVFSYTQGVKKVRSWHLFAKEASGKVSHYILLADGGSTATSKGTSAGKERLLYEKLDKYGSMSDAVNTIVFDYGDGTVHGSWGVGQILYELASTVEKIRCDSIDNMRMTNKMKLQVPDAKNVNDVKLSVNDQMMIVSGAQFAGATAALPTDIQGYELLDQKLTQIAQSKIGSFVPPIPTQPSDIKAAQINAAMSKEKEVQEASLENLLIQFAVPIQTMSKRLCNPESPDPVAKKCRAKLLEKLTPEEIGLLCDQVAVTSVMEFTQYAAQQRGLFAASVKGDPLFRQSFVARTMAAGAGDETFVQSITIPEGDQSDQQRAQREQMLESSAFQTALAIKTGVPVLPYDNDWIHMQTLKPSLIGLLQSRNLPLLQVALQHYEAHYAQGVAKKNLPEPEINGQKQFIAAIRKQMAAIQESEQLKQQHEAAVQDATAQAQAIAMAEHSEEMGGQMPQM